MNQPILSRRKLLALPAGLTATAYAQPVRAADGYVDILRQPDLATYRINLEVAEDAKGAQAVSPGSLRKGNNFFGLAAAADSPDKTDVNQFLEYLYGFMATRNIGDKQEYARRIDGLEHGLGLGAWLFSMPSLAYFGTQFDSTSISLYGVASQLSTIKQWREAPER